MFKVKVKKIKQKMLLQSRCSREIVESHVATWKPNDGTKTNVKYSKTMSIYGKLRNRYQ